MIQLSPKSAPRVHGRRGAACNTGPVQKSVNIMRAQHMSSRQRTICRFQESRSTTDASNSVPIKLAKEEMQSLQAVLKANSIPSDTGGTAAVAMDQVSDSVVKQMMSIISKGKEKEVKDLQQLEGFMLLAEQLQQQPGVASRKLAPSANPRKVDVWQPIFASAGGFPRLLYIPVPEYFDMHRAFPDATATSYSSASSTDSSTIAPYTPGSINIITELGPFTTHFLGTCKWLRADAFSYSIKKIRIDFAGRSFSFPMFLKLENELEFFLVSDDLACARSKLGGTMLLEANPSKGKKYFDTW